MDCGSPEVEAVFDVVECFFDLVLTAIDVEGGPAVESGVVRQEREIAVASAFSFDGLVVAGPAVSGLGEVFVVHVLVPADGAGD